MPLYTLCVGAIILDLQTLYGSQEVCSRQTRSQTGASTCCACDNLHVCASSSQFSITGRCQRQKKENLEQILQQASECQVELDSESLHVTWVCSSTLLGYRCESPAASMSLVAVVLCAVLTLIQSFCSSSQLQIAPFRYHFGPFRSYDKLPSKLGKMPGIIKESYR